MHNLNKDGVGKTFVFLVRHGDFDLPKMPGTHVFNHRHYPLNKTGRKQAKEVAKKFAKIKEHIDVFYASSMRRAEETAREIERKIGKKLQLSNNLWEFNKIRWTRKYYHYKFWKHWLAHRRRMKEFDRILLENPGKVILIVGHGNVIKGILAKKLGWSGKHVESIDYRNCHISLLQFNKTKLEKVCCFNQKELPKFKPKSSH